MKRIFFTFIVAVTTISCSLEETADSFVSPDVFFNSIDECEAAVNGCYNPLNSIFTKDFMMAVEATTDLMCAINSGTQDAHLNISPATARFGVTMWKQAYIGVRNCNMCVEGIETSEVQGEKKARLLAEAKTLRGFYYHLLTSLFDGVPFYKDVIRTEEDLLRIQRLPRTDAYDIREDLIAELKDCVSDLPEGRTVDLKSQRVTAAFCHMVIAKMAMWNKDWISATESLLTIQDWYKELTEDKYPIGDIEFSERNTPESIFEIQHTYTPGGLDVGTTLAAYMMPRRKVVTVDGVEYEDYYDGVRVDSLGTKSNTYTSFRPNKYFYQSLMTRNGGDRRCPYVQRWEWNGEEFSSSKSSGRPWMGTKFWCWGMSGSNDANNYPVFRYADALLMLAEVHNENDNPASACECLNQVKNRAGITPLSLSSGKAVILEEIQRERARELIGEWQRKFDLVRWGIWYKSVWNNNDDTDLINNILPCHEYYPIPDAECGLSGGQLKNEAYEKYMKK